MAEEEKREFSETTDNEVLKGAEYDVFSENVNTKKREINRDYLNKIYKGGIEINHDTITFTREMYGKMYLEIEEDFENKRKEKRREIFMYQALAIVCFLFAALPIAQTGIFLTYMYGIAGIINFFLMLICIILGLLLEFFIIGLIKKYKKLKAERQKSIDRLNQRREEAMVQGTYDSKF